MNKLIRLAAANIRKSRSHTVTLAVMFFLTAFMLNVGVLVSVKFGAFYDNMSEELNAGNVYYWLPASKYTDEVADLFKNDPNVIEYQEEDSFLAFSEITRNDKEISQLFAFFNADFSRSVSKYKFIGEHQPLTSDGIYLPYYFNITDNYSVGDKFTLEIKQGEPKKYVIKGFIEDIYGSATTGYFSVYFPSETFSSFETNADMVRFKYIPAKLKEINQNLEGAIIETAEISDVNNLLNIEGADNGMLSLDADLSKMARVMTPTIMAVMFVIFAGIIGVVCFIVIHFRISNSVEDDMMKIGSLKSVGYTSTQIMGSVTLQFSIIASLASIIGIAVSYFLIPAISSVFEEMSSLYWTQGFDPMISAAVFVILTSLTLLTSRIAASPIKKLSPITSLRGGITTHNFKRNHIPLRKTRGPLSFNLALKSIFQHKRQTVMMTVIALFVAFTSSFAVTMFYSTAVDTSFFKECPGMELTSILTDIEKNDFAALEEIRAMSEVKKAIFFDDSALNLKLDEYDDSITVHITDDFSQLELNNVYKGRFPKHSNETVLSGDYETQYGKKIGDPVILNNGGIEQNFIITGFSQGFNTGIKCGYLTLEGIRRVRPDFNQQTAAVYLEESTPEKCNEFIDKLKKQTEPKTSNHINIEEQMEAGISAYVDMLGLSGMAMLVISAGVIVLVLYFVISSSITRRRRELGIQKAVGFTTFQLMNQISIGFLPQIILGTAIGSVVCGFFANAIMSFSMSVSDTGVFKTNFIVEPGFIAVFSAAIIILSYVTSILVTLRIRKISAYALVTE